jgi:putative copper resistance protein D
LTVSLEAALTTWQFEPFAAVPAAVLAVCYLAAARRCGHPPRAVRFSPGRRRPVRPWPGWRTLAFLGGLGAITVAVQGWVDVYDDTSLADHMVQHLLPIMAAPPLLIVGRPVTLLLHTVRNPWHTRVKRFIRSRPLTVLTWPPAGVMLYSAAVLGTHLTGLLLARGAVHDGEHVAYLAAGYLYFLPVVGSEPIRRRVSVLGRYLLLLVAMPANIATGAVLHAARPARSLRRRRRARRRGRHAGRQRPDHGRAGGSARGGSRDGTGEKRGYARGPGGLQRAPRLP